LTGNINITPAKSTADVNNASFVFDGKSKASQAKGLQATITLGSMAKPVDLTSTDIQVVNDGVNVGSYQYTLTATGIAKLQQAPAAIIS
jgi:trimeric autotransporter adhesin